MLIHVWLYFQNLERRKWLDQVANSVPTENENILWTVEFLNKTIETGEKLEKNSVVEIHLERLKKMTISLNTWEEKALKILRSKWV